MGADHASLAPAALVGTRPSLPPPWRACRIVDGIHDLPDLRFHDRFLGRRQLFVQLLDLLVSSLEQLLQAGSPLHQDLTLVCRIRVEASLPGTETTPATEASHPHTAAHTAHAAAHTAHAALASLEQRRQAPTAHPSPEATALPETAPLSETTALAETAALPKPALSPPSLGSQPLEEPGAAPTATTHPSASTLPEPLLRTFHVTPPFHVGTVAARYYSVSAVHQPLPVHTSRPGLEIADEPGLGRWQLACQAILRATLYAEEATVSID
jgi:hypothetical protein